MDTLKQRLRSVGFRYLAPILSQYSSQTTEEVSRIVTEKVSAEVTTKVSAEVTARVTQDLLGALRAEMVEVARMLRQQGDAADEVAEALGRTLVRLSAEVEELSEAVRDLRDTRSRQAASTPER